MKKIIILATICMLIIAYSNLYSFDGERNGFILGGGIGAGYQININWTSGITNTVNSRVVFLTNFKIGYAPSNTSEFFYVSKVSWWGESDIAYILGLSAVATTYYFDNITENGWFISGGLGLSTLSAPFEEGVESSYGFGVFAGGGFEFPSHWNIELDLLYSTHGDDLDSFGVLLTINILAF